MWVCVGGWGGGRHNDASEIPNRDHHVSHCLPVNLSTKLAETNQGGLRNRTSNLLCYTENLANNQEISTKIN